MRQHTDVTLLHRLFHTALAVTIIGCAAPDEPPPDVLAVQQVTANSRFTITKSRAANPVSIGYSAPLGLQGATDEFAYGTSSLAGRYAALQAMGLGFKQYNVFWESLESSAHPSSSTPFTCPTVDVNGNPASYVLVPASGTLASSPYHKYRCIDSGQLAMWDA